MTKLRIATIAAGSSLAALLLAAPLTGAADSARVGKVKDGDTVTVKVGSKKKKVNLKGVAAPSGGECYAKQAKKRLGKLLGKGDAIKISGKGKSVVIKRGKTLINKKMVASGAARAGKAGGKLGKQLAKAEQKAKSKGRGLWGACETGDDGAGSQPDGGIESGGDAQPGDVTGQQAIDEMSGEISGAAFKTFKTEGSISDAYEFHFCEDKRFRYRQDTTFSDPQFSSFTRTDRFADEWTITKALIRESESYRGALVEGTFTSKRTQDGGADTTEPINEPFEGAVEQSNGQWYVAGRVASYHPGQAVCDAV